MLEHLDWLEECRESTTIRLAEYQQRLAQRYNRDVKARESSVEDLVLRKVVGNMQDAGAGVYYLEDLDEKPLPRPWNVHNLKKFYH